MAISMMIDADDDNNKDDGDDCGGGGDGDGNLMVMVVVRHDSHFLYLCYHIINVIAIAIVCSCYSTDL